MPVPANKHDIYIAEYTALQAKVSHSVGDLHTAEVVLASAMLLFYGWMFKDGTQIIQSAHYILWVPVAFPIIAGARLIYRWAYLKNLEEYLKELEAYLFSPEADSPGGWERWCVDSQKAGKRRSWAHNYIFVRGLVWIALLALSLLIVCKGRSMVKGPPNNLSEQVAPPANWHGSVNCNWKVDK